MAQALGLDFNCVGLCLNRKVMVKACNSVVQLSRQLMKKEGKGKKIICD